MDAEDYTSNPIPTSFFLIERVSKLCCEITGNIFVQKTKMKKRCRDGVTCVVLCTLPSIYLVCVVFGTAIPTSFYIFGKCFSYLFVIYIRDNGTGRVRVVVDIVCVSIQWVCPVVRLVQCVCCTCIYLCSPRAPTLSASPSMSAVHVCVRVCVRACVCVCVCVECCVQHSTCVHI